MLSWSVVQHIGVGSRNRSPWMLQNLFAIMLQTCAMSNPQQLWDNHKENLAEDILHQAQVQSPQLELDYRWCHLQSSSHYHWRQYQGFGWLWPQNFWPSWPSTTQWQWAHKWNFERPTTTWNSFLNTYRRMSHVWFQTKEKPSIRLHKQFSMGVVALSFWMFPVELAKRFSSIFFWQKSWRETRLPLQWHHQALLTHCWQEEEQLTQSSSYP